MAFDTLQLAVFEPAPDASLPIDCYAAAFPARWLRLLRVQYAAAMSRDIDKTYLPTRSLVELLDALDPHIIHVSSRLSDDVWIYAHQPLNDQVVLAAVAAWASTQIRTGPTLDWFDILATERLSWHQTTLDLLACGTQSNGTAKPSRQMYGLLPGHLAQLVTDTGLTLLGHHRDFILGPVTTSGRRCAVGWPFERIDDDEAGPGLWTPKIEFHVQTAPLHPRPRLHAELSMSRFPLQPVTYVPRRGGKGAGVTVWLHAPGGFLRAAERRTLLAARATRRPVNGEYRWAWDPGLALALGWLTSHRYPDPQDVADSPRVHTDRPVSAYLVYSGGTRLAPPGADTEPDEDDPDDDQGVSSVEHAAVHGFQPVDHLEVYERLAPLLEPHGIVAPAPIPHKTTKARALMLPRDRDQDHYTIELWTESAITRQAVIETLTQRLDFTRAAAPPSATQPFPSLLFTGPCTLTLILRDVEGITAGLPRPTKKDKSIKQDRSSVRIDATTARLNEIRNLSRFLGH